LVERSKDWLNQTDRDIRQAEASLRDELYEWSCFAAQQAAEKAVKALIQRLGRSLGPFGSLFDRRASGGY